MSRGLMRRRDGDAPRAVPPLPGVPPDWCKGAAPLAARPAPPTIPPPRWAALAATFARLLRDHGAALHGAGWDALDLFGLNRTALAMNPPGWGMTWLRGEREDVRYVAPSVIGMLRHPNVA